LDSFLAIRLILLLNGLAFCGGKKEMFCPGGQVVLSDNAEFRPLQATRFKGGGRAQLAEGGSAAKAYGTILLAVSAARSAIIGDPSPIRRIKAKPDKSMETGIWPRFRLRH
jgi:hypothetical protein